MLKRPERLVSWLESKNAPHAELPFLDLLKTEEHLGLLVQVLEKFETLKPSYSEGVKILELTIETILLSQYTTAHQQVIFEQTTSVASWIQNLTALRYPLTTRRDTDLEKKMLSLPWPYGSKVKFERRGDRAGVELKMFITSEADLVKAVAALERVQTELQK